MNVQVDPATVADSTQLEFDLNSALEPFSSDDLESMLEAGKILDENLNLLKKSGENMVGRCLAHQGTFYEEEHYPKGDVYDSQSHGQYYYHAHRPDSGEHGHFHTFLRSGGMRKSIKPAPYKGTAKRPKGKDALSHIVAISMDGPGYPLGLFTTNRWVTDETFYRAEDVLTMIDRFSIEQSYPCLATNRGVTATLRLFKPQILALLQLRDKVIEAWELKHPDRDVYEDRELEITSIVSIDREKQVNGLKRALRDRRKA